MLFFLISFFMCHRGLLIVSFPTSGTVLRAPQKLFPSRPLIFLWSDLQAVAAGRSVGITCSISKIHFHFCWIHEALKRLLPFSPPRVTHRRLCFLLCEGSKHTFDSSAGDLASVCVHLHPFHVQLYFEILLRLHQLTILPSCFCDRAGKAALLSRIFP